MVSRCDDLTRQHGPRISMLKCRTSETEPFVVGVVNICKCFANELDFFVWLLHPFADSLEAY